MKNKMAFLMIKVLSLAMSTIVRKKLFCDAVYMATDKKMHAAPR